LLLSLGEPFFQRNVMPPTATVGGEPDDPDTPTGSTMTIYAYKCASCGHAKDVLQKMSDAPLTVCPACGQASFQKQLTAAGFQLKGSGWYVTDFRNGSAAPAAGGGEASAPSTDGADKSTPAATPSTAPTASSAGATASVAAPAPTSPSKPSTSAT
jgi:putative FmdB family regulatory protein